MVICYALISISYILFLIFLIANILDKAKFVFIVSSIGFLGGLLGPSLQSIIPLIVSDKNVVKSNATLRIGLNTSSIISPGLAGLLISKTSVEIPIIIVSSFYILSVLFAFSLPKMPSASGINIFVDTLYGWKQFWKIKWLRNTSIGFSLANLIWAGFFYSLGPWIINYYERDISNWGFITGGLSADLIFGSIFFRKIEFNNPLNVGILFSIGKFLPLLSLYLGLSTPIIVFLAFLSGFFLECFIINYYSFVQINIENSILARILSIDSFIGLLLTPVGYVFSGMILKTNFIHQAGIIASFLMILIPLSIILINRKA